MQDWRGMEWGQEGWDTQEGLWGGSGAHLIPGMQLPARWLGLITAARIPTAGGENLGLII